MTNKITVVITTWQVPFDQMVKGVFEFDDVQAATSFINDASSKWWKKHHGDRSVKEGHTAEFYKPIAELGYDIPRYELWGGETAFHAMLDEASAWRLHEAHYKREYDDKGISRPGYLRVAMGENVDKELAEIAAFYSGVRH